jgi:hypothetical protein
MRNNHCIYNTYVFLIIIIKFHILIEKLCPIVKIFISKFYNNINILSKVIVITVFKNEDTLK